MRIHARLAWRTRRLPMKWRQANGQPSCSLEYGCPGSGSLCRARQISLLHNPLLRHTLSLIARILRIADYVSEFHFPQSRHERAQFACQSWIRQEKDCQAPCFLKGSGAALLRQRIERLYSALLKQPAGGKGAGSGGLASNIMGSCPDKQYILTVRKKYKYGV